MSRQIRASSSRGLRPRAAWRGRPALAAIGAFLFGAAIGDARAQTYAHAEWTTPAGGLGGARYSSLNQINTSNVGGLVEEFAFPTGAKASHQGQPLVVGTTMYVVGPFPNNLFALDLANGGKLLWTYAPNTSRYARGVACCDVVNRGAVYYKGLIIYNLLDGHTVGVNAATGAQVWKTTLADPHTGETMTMAPLVAAGRVFVGDSGAELGIRGWVAALDPATGKLLWKAYATGSDSDVKIGASFHPFYAKDRGTNLGETTWPGTLWKQGGGTSWGWFTYDGTLNLLYYGTANPGVWNPTVRPGDNKWGSTIFARSPETGQAVWAYQLTPHDGWDYDAINESIVADIDVGGTLRHVLVHFNKNGYAYTIDRATGEVLVAKPFANVTWSTGVDLATGLPQVVPSKFPVEGVDTPGICPTALGGKDWEPSAFSPKTNLFYVPAINFCETLQTLKVNFIAGAPFQGADLSFSPGPGGHAGELVAWDAGKGEKAWTVDEPYPLYGGVLATGGGLVFYATLDRYLKAVDATSGKLLFSTQMDCGSVGNPISFTGADGKQRIAIYTGIGYLAGGLGPGTCPGKGGTGKSGEVHVFKLP